MEAGSWGLGPEEVRNILRDLEDTRREIERETTKLEEYISSAKDTFQSMETGIDNLTEELASLQARQVVLCTFHWVSFFSCRLCLKSLQTD